MDPALNLQVTCPVAGLLDCWMMGKRGPVPLSLSSSGSAACLGLLISNFTVWESAEHPPASRPKPGRIGLPDVPSKPPDMKEPMRGPETSVRIRKDHLLPRMVHSCDTLTTVTTLRGTRWDPQTSLRCEDDTLGVQKTEEWEDGSGKNGSRVARAPGKAGPVPGRAEQPNDSQPCGQQQMKGSNWVQSLLRVAAIHDPSSTRKHGGNNCVPSENPETADQQQRRRWVRPARKQRRIAGFIRVRRDTR